MISFLFHPLYWEWLLLLNLLLLMMTMYRNFGTMGWLLFWFDWGRIWWSEWIYHESSSFYWSRYRMLIKLIVILMIKMGGGVIIILFRLWWRQYMILIYKLWASLKFYRRDSSSNVFMNFICMHITFCYGCSGRK